MKAIYTDLHIHTSENADALNRKYDFETLSKAISSFSLGKQALISLTDHNTINKDVYIKYMDYDENITLLLGSELHVRGYNTNKYYHCHIYFDCEISEENIDALNGILDSLYPKKMIGEKDDIHSLDAITSAFEEFNTILLPHGGQNHRPFHKAKPKGGRIDTTFERVTYYNFIDGFTSRNNEKVIESVDYFKKLGISEFTSLITCSDNYSPYSYPKTKSKDATGFIPTWMYAEPNFFGLKLSLTELDRLITSIEPIDYAGNGIKSIKLKNNDIDIDVDLDYGLNVIIGGSSSGKTLLVEAINKKLKGSIEDSVYDKFGIDEIEILNPQGARPHFISQNYISDVLSENTKLNLNDIEILNKMFKTKTDTMKRIEKVKGEIKTEIVEWISIVEELENIYDNLRKISTPHHLQIEGDLAVNEYDKLIPSKVIRDSLKYTKELYDEHTSNLDEIKTKILENPLVTSKEVSNAFEIIQNSMDLAMNNFTLETKLLNIIKKSHDIIDFEIEELNSKNKKAKLDIENLHNNVVLYCTKINLFNAKLDKIKNFNFEADSLTETTLSGHKISISNSIKITENMVLDSIKKFTSNNDLDSLDDLTCNKLFKKNFRKKKVNVTSYTILGEKLSNELTKNTIHYEIETKDKKDFEDLSPGWKSSVILDIALSYRDDSAPIVIDQPEDNLANSYINRGLIEAIKSAKQHKQIIIVSHNATIPMLGDANNIVYCTNDENIMIRSGKLEDSIGSDRVIDLIAEITDGGKASIKKRFKKYDIRKYKGVK